MLGNTDIQLMKVIFFKTHHYNGMGFCKTIGMPCSGVPAGSFIRRLWKLPHIVNKFVEFKTKSRTFENLELAPRQSFKDFKLSFSDKFIELFHSVLVRNICTNVRRALKSAIFICTVYLDSSKIENLCSLVQNKCIKVIQKLLTLRVLR